MDSTVIKALEIIILLKYCNFFKFSGKIDKEAKYKKI